MTSALVVRFVFWLWLGAALYMGRQLVLQRLPPTAIPLILGLLTVTLVYGYFRFKAVRAWADGLDLRALVGLHISRFVGIYFIVLYQQGQLPYAFAVPGGIGDIIVATLALVIVAAPLSGPARLRAIGLWNIVGLVDILLVVVTAVRLNQASPYQMLALTRLPLSLLPTFLVPLIIASHIVIFTRLARNQATT